MTNQNFNSRRYTAVTVCVAALLTACATPAPSVASKHLFVDTAAFTPVFLASVDGGPKQLLGRTGARVFEGENEPFLWAGESLVVADTGLYVVDWDPSSATLRQRLYLKAADIKRVAIATKKKSMFLETLTIEVEAKGQTFRFGVPTGGAKGIELAISDLITPK
jgi:hypothetical protein